MLIHVFATFLPSVKIFASANFWTYLVRLLDKKMVQDQFINITLLHDIRVERSFKSKKSKKTEKIETKHDCNVRHAATLTLD